MVDLELLLSFIHVFTRVAFMCICLNRNDYVILRVTFSEEENAKITGGRTLRCVPSRQAETAEIKVLFPLQLLLKFYLFLKFMGLY